MPHNVSDRLKVAVITTLGCNMHKALCVSVSKQFDLVGVINPVTKMNPNRRFLNYLAHRKSISKFGVWYHVIRKLGSDKFKVGGWDFNQDFHAWDDHYFGAAQGDYDRLIASRAHSTSDVNSAETIELLRGWAPDVVLVSGGPIYRKALIESVPLMLNFHTGISPVYNGSQSIYWTFVNGQPHVTGGTLMVINAEIDGGEMLAHFQPSVEPGDTPGRQFMKTFKGGLDLYLRFLEDYQSNRAFVSVPQGKPFHYTVDADWTWVQKLVAARLVRDDICAKYQRPIREMSYWTAGTVALAQTKAQKFLHSVVFDA